MDDSTPRPPGPTGEEQAARPAGLQRGAIGLAGDFIGAISDVAPTLDVGLTLAAFVIAVGLAGPSSILITGVAMLCVATGYARLNRADPNAAAGVPWLRKIMPAFGFAMGLLVILTITFILISNVSLMGSTVLSLFNSGLTSNAFVVWAIGASLLFLTVVIAVFGLRVQIRFQGIIVIFEYAIVIFCAAAILWAHANGRLSHAPHPSLGWLSPTSSGGSISAGIVLGVFTLGGWENPIYLAEEQRNARRDPGRAAYLGIVWGAIFIAFLMFAFQSAAPASEMVKHGGNVLGYATGLVLPQPWPTLIDLALLSSLIAGIQATASDGARTAFGMARARILPQVFGRISPRYRTPSAAFIIIGITVVALSALYAASSGVVTILANVTSTAGFLYTIVYVSVALTAIWAFKAQVLASVRGFLIMGVVPLIGAAVLMYAFVKSLSSSAAGVIWPTVIVLAVVLALGFALQNRSRVPFFQPGAAEASAWPEPVLDDEGPGPGPAQADVTDRPPLEEHS
jgi:amino acid transporter